MSTSHSRDLSRRELLAAAAAAAAATASPRLARAGVPTPVEASPDAVFIGAGINSLGAAFLLAKAGWSVLVLDGNKQPGGAVRTLELTLPGFRHDIGAMNLTPFAHSPFVAEHGADLARHGAEFVTAKQSFGSIAADGRFLGLTTDLAQNLRSIAEFSRADAEAWTQWRRDFDQLAPILFQILGSPQGRSGPLEYVFGQGADVPPAAVAPLRGILIDSLRQNLTARFESDVVQALVAAWGLHLDYAPDISGGCWMPFLESNADERSGISLVKGGSGRVIEALVGMIRELGGQVETSRTVEKIVIDGGRASGVQLAGGDVIRADRAVVASVTPTALLKLTDRQLPEAIARRSANWVYGPGTMVIHLALSGLPDWTSGEAARSSFYVHLGPSLDALAGAYQKGLAGQLSAEPFCVVAQPTVHDPTRAPAGQHVLWIMVRAVPAVITSDELGQIGGPAWTESASRAFADRVLALVERHAPGLSSKVLARSIISPTDLERLNPNLVGGDLNAGSSHLSQFYGQRPFPGGSRSPLPGLHMCGASTWPGGGANPVSGILLAEQLLAS